MLISNPEERAKRSDNNRTRILEFLRDETWSEQSILQQVVGYSARQSIHRLLVKMERDGYIRHRKHSILDKRSITLWGITSHGLAYSWSEGDSIENRPIYEPSKVPLSSVAHQLDLQVVRLEAERFGWSEWVRGERLGFKPDPIRPDAYATRPDGVTVAIEVERNIKTRKRYQQVISGHCMAMSRGKWRGVIYVTPSGMAKRLARVFNSIDYFHINKQRTPFSDELRRRFRFVDIQAFHYEADRRSIRNDS